MRSVLTLKREEVTDLWKVTLQGRAKVPAITFVVSAPDYKTAKRNVMEVLIMHKMTIEQVQ